MKAALGDQLAYGVRNNLCYVKGNFVSYPFENGIHALDAESRYTYVRDFFRADRSSAPKRSLKDWVVQRFGESIAEDYLLPYNEKIWKYPIDELVSDWVDGRVPIPTNDEMLKIACGLSTIGNSHQSRFVYPRSGGIETLVKYYSANVPNISLQSSVGKIERENGRWLVSTIPIQELIECLGPLVPQDVRQHVNKLKYNSLINVAIGYKSSLNHDHTAVYIPDTAHLPHRISFPRSFSRFNVPEGYELVNLEITIDREMQRFSDVELRSACVKTLRGLGYMGEESIDYFRVLHAKYAYVVQDAIYAQSLGNVLEFLNDLGIYSLGRNAEFLYINMDEAIRRSHELADRLLSLHDMPH
jgi:protoporphyrinogen oxidase